MANLTVAFTEPLNPLGGVNTARSLEYTVSQKIKEAGDEGITHAVSMILALLMIANPRTKRQSVF